MKPDKFDLKIKDAAAQSESDHLDPGQAWGSMEELLNKEMPQKKDNKRFLWLFFLLFLAAGIFLIYNPWNTKEGENILAKEITVKKPTAENDTKNETNNKPDDKPNTVNIKDTNNDTGATTHFSYNTTQSSSQARTYSQKPASHKKTHESIELVSESPKENINNKVNTPGENKDKDGGGEILKQNIAANENEEPEENKHAMKKNNEPVTVNEDVANKDTVSKKNDVLVSKDTSHTVVKKNPAAKNKNKFASSFAITLSAGPDISAVDLNNIGKVNPVYGAGISYKLSKKFTLRTGFYVERKVYDANAGDYHPPARFWNYYPDLKYIDAACKIYEVPVIVNYNFSQSSKHTWFASAGVSSYFMKKEDYDFYSKTSAGIYGSYTVDNKNQHYFSSLRLSAGYERRLSNTISFMAEPYFNMPLKGVGYGKVKLYSAGVLFTLTVKPFTKK